MVLRWDRTTGDIVLVSQTSGGDPLLEPAFRPPDVSDDGNASCSSMAAASPEVALGHRGIVYRRDIAAGTLTQVSTVPLVGVTFRGVNESPSISGDGGTIAYGVGDESGDLSTRQDRTVYIVDTATNTVRTSYAEACSRGCRATAPLRLHRRGPGQSDPRPASMSPAANVAAAPPHSAVRRRWTLPVGPLFASGPLDDFQYGSNVIPVRHRVGRFDAAER